MTKWINTKEKHAPWMEDILFIYKKEVRVGWNEGNPHDGEEPSYIIRNLDNGSITSVNKRYVKYWMLFPEPPEEKKDASN